MNLDQKHSGIGIASFILSIVVAIAMFFVFVFAAVMASRTHGVLDPNSLIAIVIGFGIVLCLVLDLVALGLGISGLLQKDRKKIFALLGTIFSASTIIGASTLIIIGIRANA